MMRRGRGPTPAPLGGLPGVSVPPWCKYLIARLPWAPRQFRGPFRALLCLQGITFGTIRDSATEKLL
eukprot:1568632-Pyramimonas_sp.AAC.1